MLLKHLGCSLLLVDAKAFVGNHEFRRSVQLEMAKESDDGISRRSLMAGVLSTAPVLLASQHAQAKDEIFKGNPLTNPVLEQVRFICPSTSRVAKST